MIKHIKPIVIAFLSLFVAYLPASAQRLIRDFGIPEKDFVDTIKITMWNGAIIVPVDIEGETKFLVEKYGWGSQAMKSNIYPIVWRMMNGEISREEAIKEFELDDWHLAKRQLTWFKRNKEIIWLTLEEVYPYVINYLSKTKK